METLNQMSHRYNWNFTYNLDYFFINVNKMEKYITKYYNLKAGSQSININQILDTAVGVYINAHGIVPIPRNIPHKGVIYDDPLDGHEYNSLDINSYVGRVPPNTILVTVTPDDHFLCYDLQEKIAKRLMYNLGSRGLGFLLGESGNYPMIEKDIEDSDISDEGDDISDDDDDNRDEDDDNNDEDEINRVNYSLKRKVNKIIREENYSNSKIAEMIQVNTQLFTSWLRGKISLENLRKIIPKLEEFVDQYEKPKISDSPLFYMQEFKKNLKVFMPGDEYFNMEVVFERSLVNDIFYLNGDNVQVLDPYYRGLSKIKAQSSFLNKDTINRVSPYELPYYPYSLSALIDKIRATIGVDEWIIVYDFMCNPLIDDSLRETNIPRMRSSLNKKGLEKARQLRMNLSRKPFTRSGRLKDMETISSEIPESKDYSPFEKDEDT